MTATATRLGRPRRLWLTRNRSRVVYAVLAVALLAAILGVLIGSDADWWPAVAFSLMPDLAVLYGVAPGLARGQLHPRAVPLHNALHRFWGPLALILGTVAAGASPRLVRGWARRGIPCRI